MGDVGNRRCAKSEARAAENWKSDLCKIRNVVNRKSEICKIGYRKWAREEMLEIGDWRCETSEIGNPKPEM